MEKSEEYFSDTSFILSYGFCSFFRLSKLVPLPYFLLIRAVGLVSSTILVISFSTHNRGFGAEITKITVLELITCTAHTPVRTVRQVLYCQITVKVILSL